MHPRLIVITGSSGVGKSTVAQALQEQLLPTQWLHFSVDSIFYCLARSLVLRIDQANDRAFVDSRAIVASAFACTKTLLDLGHHVIFDAVILSETGAQRMRQAFDEFNPLLVNLACSWDEIKRRTLSRGDRTVQEAEHGYKNAGPHLEAHYSFDTTTVSSENIAAKLAAHLHEGRSAA